jgi:hypothetical protein
LAFIGKAVWGKLSVAFNSGAKDIETPFIASTWADRADRISLELSRTGGAELFSPALQRGEAFNSGAKDIGTPFRNFA